MKKISLFLFIFLITLNLTQAQNEMDALRYSMIDPGGTARFSGMAGAFGALGGDFSALSINPAGIGIFRSSEITITPSMSMQSVESQLFGTSEIDDKYSFNLNNLGLVFSIPIGSASEGSGLKFVNFGVGVNRHNNFNNRWLAEGFNNTNSLMTSLLEQANVQGSVENLDDFSTGLAWDTYLLDMEDGTFFVDMYDGQVLQTQIMNSSGYVRELVFSLGTNYNDMFYFGASVGLPSVRYKQSGTLMEINNDSNVNAYFNSLTYTEAYETKGTGFNVKFGGIARLGSIRLGAALHTPTFYSLEDVYTTTMRSDLNLDPESYPGYTESAKFAESPTGNFKYELNTPLKAIGSLGLVFGTAGLISLDYEYIDYTNARLRSDDYVFTQANKMIKSNLNAQHNIRVGGEIQVKPVILRAGYGYYSSPYQKGINDAQRSVIAAGFGFRDRHYSVDFSYSYSFFSEDYILYQVENVQMSPLVSRDFAANTFKITFGWRF